MLSVHLEQIHHPLAAHPPLVLIDLRVHLFRMMSFVQSAHDLCADEPGKFRLWCRANWSICLNEPVMWLKHRSAKGYQVLVLDDCKDELNAYWRQYVCMAEGLPDYKGNRLATKPELYCRLHESALEYLSTPNCPIPLFRQSGFEADDWAGSVYRALSKKSAQYDRTVYLSTCDSDWQQLVDDKLNIMFANTYLHKPRLRSTAEVLKWCLGKGYIASRPSEIAHMKHIQGDTSDNLLAGSPIGLFDLISPLKLPALEHLARLDNLLSEEPTNNITQSHAKQSRLWLARNGLPTIQS